MVGKRPDVNIPMDDAKVLKSVAKNSRELKYFRASYKLGASRGLLTKPKPFFR